MIGRLIDNRYQIEAELGRGGMGVVYKAQDTLLERPVAVKVVLASGLGTEGRNRLLQEARAAARLNHPNIVAVHDVGVATIHGQVEPTSYIVMELVEGRSLREFQPVEFSQMLRVAIGMCDALAAAHQQGIIHRDLKPENVIMTPTESVKLMDFGLARIAGTNRLTQEGTFMGTVSYLAPEIIMGQDADDRSDLYALGVVLYELSAGRAPFEAQNLTAVISQHLHAPVIPPSLHNSKLPPAFDDLIVQLMSKRPTDRPPSAASVLESFKAISSDFSYSPALDKVPQLRRLVRGRMVGREAEFAEAVSLWERSASGDGRLLLISGEPGIGKTRLVREFATYVEISGGTTLTGLCFAEERTPYGPIAQMVQTSFENGHNLDLPQGVMADLLSLSPELRLSFPDVRPNERLDPEAEQQRLFNSIITWFGYLSRDRNLMMVVEDVHWADSGSLALLRFLARRLKKRRAMIVATYREVELDAALPFQEMLVEINRERLATRIKLTSLTKAQTRELLTTLFSEEVTAEFLDGIYRETEGNPFFIEEVCKALVDSGKLHFEGGRWHRPESVEELEIPQGIRFAIQSRLAKLSPEEQQALQVAALLGREFEYAMLVSVSDLEEDALISTLERADVAQLVEEVRSSSPGAPLRFTFTHALIHSTLLSELSTLRRQRLQRHVALALEAHFPERHRELAPLLGRYFAEAGDGEKGVKYLLAAGDAARAVFAYGEAIAAYEHALLFLKEMADHERAARTLMKLGLTFHNIFNFESSRRAYEEGFAQWQMAADKKSSNGEPKAPAPHPFRGMFGLPPATLDPTHFYDAFSVWCINQLFSGLLQLTAEDELLPDVAQSWELLDEGRKYIFHLRHDVLWSDGQPVTAGDFEFAWKRTLHPENSLGLPQILFDIKHAREFREGIVSDADLLGVKAVDDHTLEVELESPSSSFLQIMALGISKPVPRHVVERLGDDWSKPENIVTNGPFRLKSLIDEKEMVFERSESYHGHFGGNISLVELVRATDEEVVRLYEEDQLDIIYPFSHLGIAEGKRMLHLHPDEYISLPAPSTYYLVLDTTQPPFDDARVRQAMALAIDRPTLLDRMIQGIAFPATGGLVPPGIAGHVPGIALPYDPEQARSRMAEAGYPGGEGTPLVTALALESSLAREILAYFSSQWEEILGLRFSIRFANFASFFEEINSSRYHIWLTGWTADYPDPDSFLRYDPWLANSGWHNERFEYLVQEARRITDQERRMELYREAEQILVDEAPVVPINYGRQQLLVKPWVPVMPASIISGNILKDIVIEPH